MTIEELERVVATSPDSYMYEPDRAVSGRTLIALCRGLLTFEGESKLVRLVHYTAKDTLQGLLRDAFPFPHSLLASVCVAHLTACGFQNTTIRTEDGFIEARRADPLLAYASDAWASHARVSLGIEDTRRRIGNFISESKAFPAFTSRDFSRYFDILSSLHILALYNLPLSLISPDNLGDPNIATQIDGESPLALASWHGHEQAAASLLAHPAIQINLASYGGWPVLLIAAYNGHGGIVRLLLARPEIQVQSKLSLHTAPLQSTWLTLNGGRRSWSLPKRATKALSNSSLHITRSRSILSTTTDGRRSCWLRATAIKELSNSYSHTPKSRSTWWIAKGGRHS
ncbi:hypothetical protein BKA70DRAFT_522764 [Coprinopsis sp. MPI-PUGE-AT-0042]|nr:hypothetical protein BKA70DRAFT_522764 [Coprinopsis sp. MPI-PUGE-AT-0042]